MDYERLYAYRFRNVDQRARERVWGEIARYLTEDVLGRPARLLDPAAGRCEFISAAPAPERWAVDAVAYQPARTEQGVRLIVSDVMEAELPSSYFDAILVSNFVEHLPDPDAVHRFLVKMRGCARPGGRVAVLGPNFRYCRDEYFDCADHTLALTHVAIAEHLYAAGFRVARTIPRFLPYSFRGRLPASAALTRAYLRLPVLWRILGRQYLVIGERDEPGAEHGSSI